LSARFLDQIIESVHARARDDLQDNDVICAHGHELGAFFEIQPLADGLWNDDSGLIVSSFSTSTPGSSPLKLARGWANTTTGTCSAGSFSTWPEE
jgi:hypothetical protein